MASVYLGGRINGLSYDAAMSRRDEARAYLEAFGFTCLDPMRGKEQLADIGTRLDDQAAAQAIGIVDFQSCIDRDELDIRHSDYYLNLTGDTPGWGTGIEIGFAYYCLRIPIVSVGNTDPASGWLALKSTAVEPTVRDACCRIAALQFGCTMLYANMILAGLTRERD